MANETFTSWREELLRSSSLMPLRLGVSQEEVIALFGPPDDVSALSKKGRPLILKYRDIEFHFDEHHGHTLWLIHAEDADGNPRLSLR